MGAIVKTRQFGDLIEIETNALWGLDEAQARCVGLVVAADAAVGSDLLFQES